MNKGDRVCKEPMWKYERAEGNIVKITADGYIVVKWDGINGEWHYTKEQAKALQPID